MKEKNYDHILNEAKWTKYWQENNIYKFEKNKKEVFSIDTPPPTVNGNIHIGHIFSYTQTELIARYKRLMGYNVFYPFGFDDNGLPSERLVEKEQEIKAHEVSREEFTKMCLKTTSKYEKEFKKLFTNLGLSVDWDLEYRTVSESTKKISQLSFLDLVEKEKVYHKESPSLWCNECLTSIAQAELETKENNTTFNYIKFKTTKDEEIEIATTRPELLPAIVAVMINPNNKKTEFLKGQTIKVPLINVEVPVIEDEKVLVDKGSGIVMSCTFGDQTDIEWWRKYDLPLKNILSREGKIKDNVENYGGLTVNEARKKIIFDLTNNDLMIKQEDLKNEIQVHERCGKPIEYDIIKQWFIKILEHKEDFIKMGNKVKWNPSHMQNRYNDWVNNIMWDWGISRQRYFGIPFPVWFCDDCGKIVFAKKEELPIDPTVTTPKDSCSCGSNNFTPDNDVMDTWATSSVTPLINMKYGEEFNYEDILRPMDIRTNASDIIRTWDFYTIVKSFYHFKEIPWKDVVISGFIMAGKGEKISKSKSNSKIEPNSLLNEYGADVVRYWTASGRLGTDIMFSEDTLNAGKRLTNKLWNAAKLIDIHLEDYENEVVELEEMDKWIIGKYMKFDQGFTKHLDKFEVGLGMSELEKFFWDFCDDYLELVKHRLYKPEEYNKTAKISGQFTIKLLFRNILQKFAIYFPFITEEIYQTIFKEEISIHNTIIKKLEYNFNKELESGNQVFEIYRAIRGAKTKESVSLKTIVKSVNITANKELINFIKSNIKDIEIPLYIEKIILTEVNNNNIVIDNILLDIEQQEKTIDKEVLKKELSDLLSSVERRIKLLNNPNYVKNAPDKIINEEKSQLQVENDRINTVKQQLK